MYWTSFKYTLEKAEGAIKNGQYRETGNIGHTRRRKTKQKHSTKLHMSIIDSTQNLSNF